MRILILNKRHPQGRDMMKRPYGRFHFLPLELSGLGVEVSQIFIGHRGDDPCSDIQNGVKRVALAVTPKSLYRCWADICRICDEYSPEWVAGFSDTWYGWLAHRLATRANARLWVDAYDNFEAYMPWNLPLHQAWRHAVRCADLVTAAGPQLAERLNAHRHIGRSVQVLPMAADPNFTPRDKSLARRRLGLPENRLLIGHCGSFDKRRGSALLLNAVNQLRMKRNDVSLVLSGRQSAVFNSPPEVLGLGYLDDSLMPELLSSLDVASITLRNNAFGKFSYPAKLYEAMACGVPVVASATAPARWILKNNSQYLADVGSAEALAEGILRNACVGQVNYPDMQTWSEIAEFCASLLYSK